MSNSVNEGIGYIGHSVQNVLTKNIIDKVFLKDFKKAFVFKKTDKLAQAVSLVLTYSPNKTTTLSRLETLSVELPGEVLREHLVSECDPARTVLEILSLLEVARSTNQIHQGNAELLLKEYQYLLTTMCDHAGDSVTLDVTVEQEVTDMRPGARAKLPPKRHVSNSVSSRASTQKQIPPSSTDRTEKILQVIRSKGQASIKDISNVVYGVSEKTIQRELSKLIDKGHIRKEGERRWSTYHYVA